MKEQSASGNPIVLTRYMREGSELTGRQQFGD